MFFVLEDSPSIQRLGMISIDRLCASRYGGYDEKRLTSEPYWIPKKSSPLQYAAHICRKGHAVIKKKYQNRFNIAGAQVGVKCVLRRPQCKRAVL